MGEFAPQAVVMLLRGGEPNAVVAIGLFLVAQTEDDFVGHVDGQAPEQGTGPGFNGRERVQDKGVRNGLGRLLSHGRRARTLCASGYRAPGFVNPAFQNSTATKRRAGLVE